MTTILGMLGALLGMFLGVAVGSLGGPLGCSFSELLSRYRVREAGALLEDPGFDHLTTEAIGYEAGFRSRSAFHSAYKRERGETPTQAATMGICGGYPHQFEVAGSGVQKVASDATGSVGSIPMRFRQTFPRARCRRRRF